MPNMHLESGLLMAVMAAVAHAGSALPELHADLSQTSVSGLSSGAFMAAQFSVANASFVHGVGIVAGGPFYCAGEPEGVPPLWNALSRCMNPASSEVPPPDAATLWSRAQQFAQAGLIDDVALLRQQRVYLFSGTRDETVTQPVVAQARAFYLLAGAADVVYVDNVAAGHGMVTDRSADQACDVTGPPFFVNCHRPLAREMLTEFYPGLAPAAVHASGKLQRFDQARYGAATAGMAANGYVYVPKACRSGGCRVHVVFHGCRQGIAAIGNHFTRYAGYNEVADTNRLIVLYPQVEPTVVPYNPKGCWDFWGYASANYYTRAGAQIATVKAMLDQLAR